MSRLFTVGSIVFHAVVLTAVFIAQLLAVGPLPFPHQAIAFDVMTPIKVVDLPAPPVRTSAPARQVDVGAPIAAPEGITKETGLEGLAVRPSTADTIVGVDANAGAVDTIGTVVGSPALPPAPEAPRTPLRLHAGIQPPQKLVHVAPDYPLLARNSRVEAVVILEAVIGAAGDVESARVLRGHPLLDAGALDAVRKWRFTPARLNNEAVPVVMTVTVTFTLQK